MIYSVYRAVCKYELTLSPSDSGKVLVCTWSLSFGGINGTETYISLETDPEQVEDEIGTVLSMSLSLLSPKAYNTEQPQWSAADAHLRFPSIGIPGLTE